MNAYFYPIVVLLSAIILALIIKIFLLKKSAKEIKSQIQEKTAEETNTPIGISSADKDMRSLAAAINKELKNANALRHKYSQGDRELKQAITNISHDLRTPLTAILGYTEMAKCEEDREKVDRYLSVIESRSEKMKELTDELFAYSVINLPDKELNITKTDIRSVLEDSIAENYVLLTVNGIMPVIEISETPVIKDTDTAALQRVFSNVISNAAKYSDGDLTVTMKESGEIAFSNTAEKLSAIETGRLFDRFFTVEDGRNSTGLGLSIAKCLTEKMGGTISAEYKNKTLTIKLKF